MGDTTITKIDSRFSPHGAMGQKYLATGKRVGMRLWENEQPSDAGEPVARAYETIGFVVSGRAELHSEGQVVLLEPGNSWVVPEGAAHAYKILEAFTAVEVTSPPAQAHGRDEPGAAQPAQ